MIEFTDGRYREVVGDYTINVWETNPREVVAYPTDREYADCIQIDGRGMVFEVRGPEQGYGYHSGSPEDRAAPLALIERMIAVWRALGGGP